MVGEAPSTPTSSLQYNYVLAAALDTGTAFAGIIIFFAVSYSGYSFPAWWGNTVFVNTVDGKGVA
ncbi:hypothetical protein LTR66_003457 [Elasticomyces elasticus]|nr:hypothetical protein LTR50_005613 [Elasticomyces elasticus]KAK4997066.1 hypothetical protein LTR66_003457 [Elasticomyces elasticus]KAK5007791.1 hypothetical protein LTR28_004828 [Elasticomyces elasticus]